MTNPRPIESKLLQLRERFAAALPGRIDDLAEAVARCEADPATLHHVERAFHTLAGTAGTYGMTTISALAAEGERAADVPDLGHSPMLINAMRRAIGVSAAAHIFCVDDDPMHTSYLAAILESAGHEIHTARDAAEFQALLAKVRPDAIVMDYILPDCTGVDLARIVRADPSYATLPIVFLTGRRGVEHRIEAVNVGGDDFLTKPVDPVLLLSVIASRLQRSQSMQALIDHDGLTGVLNRAAFMRRAETAVAASRRSSVSTALVMLDLD